MSASKKRKQPESSSYYRVIDGRKYDSAMLTIAENAQKSHKKIRVADAKQLFNETIDANTYTDVEKGTMHYIRDTFTFEPAADKWFRSSISSWAAKKAHANASSSSSSTTSTTSPNTTETKASPNYPTGYKIIKGKRYDKGMLTVATFGKAYGNSETLDKKVASRIIEEALDGNRYTSVEKQTMAYIRENFKFTKAANALLDKAVQDFENKKLTKAQLRAALLETGVAAKAKNVVDYPKGFLLIDGQKFDQGMMQVAEEKTKGRGDGRISVNDAKAIWEEAADGDRFSPTERKTLEFIKSKWPFTDAATQWIDDAIKKFQDERKAKLAKATSDVAALEKQLQDARSQVVELTKALTEAQAVKAALER